MSKLIVTLDKITNTQKFQQCFDKKENKYLLPLWPNEFDEDLFNSVELISTLQFLKKVDHYKIADLVLYYSQNWWALYDSSNTKEPSLDGLKINQIFRYEFEQVFSRLLMQLSVVDSVLQEKKISQVVFVSQDRENKQKEFESVLDIFTRLNLGDFFTKKYKEIDFIEFKISGNITSSRITRYLERAKFIRSKGGAYLFGKIKHRLINNNWKREGIIINNSERCLENFIKELPKDESIQVLGKLKMDYNFNEIQLKSTLNDNVDFLGLSLITFFNPFFKIALGNFHNLKNGYVNLLVDINKYRPKMFLTVTMASSSDLVKVWAFKQSEIRTIWSSEGLGQPNPLTARVFDAVFHPEIDIERWVFSKLFANYFVNLSKPIRVTGYFGSIHQNVSFSSPITKTKKQICFALASANPYVARAIEGEDFFEILESVSNVAKVVDTLSDVDLIIKLHPGDAKNIAIYKAVCSKFSNVIIEPFGNLNKIIEESNLVIIYNTSVGIESLLMKKNVICYNYTQRETYITGLKDFVNSKPNNGASLVFANSQEQLRIEIVRLLNYSVKKNLPDSLSYVLENARPNYNSKLIVEGLLKNE